MEQKPVGAHVLFPELSYTIMQIAFEIHNTLGPGFTENIYEVAFRYELKNHRIEFEQQRADPGML
jgi:GxxExxY protein